MAGFYDQIEWLGAPLVDPATAARYIWGLTTLTSGTWTLAREWRRLPASSEADS